MNAEDENITTNPGFSDEADDNCIIKVIGVGGGGSNAINHMYQQDIKRVSFVVCNTDRQALNSSVVPTKVLIGRETTKGLGAGNKPEIAKQAAEESKEELAKLFDDQTQMVFITAGMGGGTGTGAAPVVAKIAKEKGVLTIGIVTIPFLFEGEKKIIKALKGAEEMSRYVDALLVINNERLTEIYKELDFINAFGKADDTLSTAARSISELITCEGRINIDFRDVDTTLRDSGVAIISSGYGEGEHRVTKAIEDALESPLLRNRDVYGSKRILVNIYFSRNARTQFLMDEVNEMREFMCNFVPDVDVIWGLAFDDTLDEKVKITILAAGFDADLSTENKTLRTTTPAQEPVVSNISPMPVEQPVASPAFEEPTATDNTSRLVQEYGKDKIIEREMQMARARYMVMSPEDYDNDEVLNMIERTPTYRRSSKFREEVRSKTANSNNAYSIQSPNNQNNNQGNKNNVINFDQG